MPEPRLPNTMTETSLQFVVAPTEKEMEGTSKLLGHFGYEKDFGLDPKESKDTQVKNILARIGTEILNGEDVDDKIEKANAYISSKKAYLKSKPLIKDYIANPDSKWKMSEKETSILFLNIINTIQKEREYGMSTIQDFCNFEYKAGINPFEILSENKKGERVLPTSQLILQELLSAELDEYYQNNQEDLADTVIGAEGDAELFFEDDDPSGTELDSAAKSREETLNNPEVKERLNNAYNDFMSRYPGWEGFDPFKNDLIDHNDLHLSNGENQEPLTYAEVLRSWILSSYYGIEEVKHFYTKDLIEYKFRLDDPRLLQKTNRLIPNQYLGKIHEYLKQGPPSKDVENNI